MKVKLLAIALFPPSMLTTACQVWRYSKAGDVAMSVLHQQKPIRLLASYQWSTRTGTYPKLLVYLTNCSFEHCYQLWRMVAAGKLKIIRIVTGPSWEPKWHVRTPPCGKK